MPWKLMGWVLPGKAWGSLCQRTYPGRARRDNESRGVRESRKKWMTRLGGGAQMGRKGETFREEIGK